MKNFFPRVFSFSGSQEAYKFALVVQHIDLNTSLGIYQLVLRAKRSWKLKCKLTSLQVFQIQGQIFFRPTFIYATFLALSLYETLVVGHLYNKGTLHC